MNEHAYDIRRYGPLALLVRFRADPLGGEAAARAAAQRLAVVLRRQTRVVDAVAAYDEVLVSYRQREDEAVIRGSIAQYSDQLAASDRTDAPARVPRLHVYDVRYDGPDLAYVAEVSGLSVGEVAALHAGVEYEVFAVGFQPGFAYLGELPQELRMPRRATPRPRVGAGSVAIALDQTAVYPNVSPGGWHLIGRMEDFGGDVDFGVATGLTVGDRVRFKAVTP